MTAYQFLASHPLAYIQGHRGGSFFWGTAPVAVRVRRRIVRSVAA